jgi:L-aspartate oxidase
VSVPCDTGAEAKDVGADEKIIDLKGIMVKYCGILRNGVDLLYGLNRVEDMLRSIENACLRTVKEMELYNMTTVALEVLKGAYNRKESVGAHYRIDQV